MPSKIFTICNSYESGQEARSRRTAPLPASTHSAKECSEAFEWLRNEATRDGASPHAGVALDELHALADAADRLDAMLARSELSSPTG